MAVDELLGPIESAPPEPPRRAPGAGRVFRQFLLVVRGDPRALPGLVHDLDGVQVERPVPREHVRVPVAARRGELRRRAAGRRVLPLAREQRDPQLRVGDHRHRVRGAGRVRDRPHALSRPRCVPVDQRGAPDRAAGRHADPALHAVHAVLDGLDLLGRDHPLRRSYAPVLRLPPVELLPGDPPRAVRVGGDGRRLPLHDPAADPAAALGSRARHARRRQRALGLERAADRTRLPARRGASGR